MRHILLQTCQSVSASSIGYAYLADRTETQNDWLLA